MPEHRSAPNSCGHKALLLGQFIPKDLATWQRISTDAGLQTDWTPHAVLDAKTITNYRNAINDLNDRIAFAQDTGNTHEVETLEKEKDDVLRELSKQKGLPEVTRESSPIKKKARAAP